MPLISKGEYHGWFVYHTTRFETACKNAGAQFSRFQSVWSQLRRTITTDPSQGGTVPVAADGVLCFAGDPNDLLPKVRIRYRHGNGKVVMVDLECS